MSIAFESEEVQSQKLRERLRQMSDDELIKFGKMVRQLSTPGVSVTPNLVAIDHKIDLPETLPGSASNEVALRA